MTFILDIHLGDHKKRTYRIDAKDEAEAKERLLLRLPPHQRDKVVVDMIKIDPQTIGLEEPFGIFGEE